MWLIKANEATATRRRLYFHLVDAIDGITPETGEAGGQPQISVDGGAFADTGIGVLVAVGNGRYYAELTQVIVATAGTRIASRYKSANTAECPGDSVQVVAFDPDAAAGLGLTNLDVPVSSRTTGSLDYLDVPVSSRSSGSAGSSDPRLNGLLHENSVIDNQMWTLHGSLASARVRCYNSRANTLLSGSGGLAYMYSVSASYDEDNRLTAYTMLREV